MSAGLRTLLGCAVLAMAITAGMLVAAPRDAAPGGAATSGAVPGRGSTPGKGAAPGRGPAWRAAIARGLHDFSTGSCISCHALGNISHAGAAIDLTHEGSRRTYAWLLHELRFPTSPRPPTPPGQAQDLAAFLGSLR